MSKPPLAWVTGAAGLIGSYAVRVAGAVAPGWRVRGLTRFQVDLADRQALEAAFAADRPSLVIHCAALTRNPACTADPGLARRQNVEVTQALVECCDTTPLVFLSTDLVFDGRQGAYTETDLPHPLSVYAETKAEAEQVVLRHRGNLVIRTSLNGGTSPTGDRGFNEQLRRAWIEGREPGLFTDEYRAPIFAGVTAQAVWALALQGAAGLYHVAGRERLSRFEIGQRLAERWPQLLPRLRPESIRNYPGPSRPPDTTLDCSKAEASLGFALPAFSEWLDAHPLEVF